jgi:hypothetical protein
MPNQPSQMTIEAPVCFPMAEVNRDFLVLRYAPRTELGQKTEQKPRKQIIFDHFFDF